MIKKHSYKIHTGFLLRAVLGVGVCFSFIENIYPQCTDSLFNVGNNFCAEENLVIENYASVGSEIVWDFCVGELSSSPVVTSLLTSGSFKTPTGIDVLEEDSVRYGFVASRDNDKLFVIRDLDNEQIVEEINVSTDLVKPEWFEVTAQGADWIGFALKSSGANSGLVRLIFEEGFTLDPITKDFGSIGGLLKAPRGLEMVDSGEGKFLFINNYSTGELISVSFGDSWRNDITGADVKVVYNELEGAFGLSFIKSCGEWYAIVNDFKDGKIKLLDFGSSLNNSPDVSLLADISSPTDGNLVEDGGEYYAFVSAASGEIYKFHFGNSLKNTPVIQNMGSFGSLNFAYGFTMSKLYSNWQGYVLNYGSSRISAMVFDPEGCQSSIAISSEFEPTQVFYRKEGTYQIGIKVVDSLGGVYTTKQEVKVSSDVAPSISMQLDANRCLSNPISFESQNASDDATSYYWDFGNGDFSNAKDTSYQYTDPGTYEVRLFTGNGICENTDATRITVYPEPKEVDFQGPGGTPCTFAPLYFENLTNDKDFDGGLQYFWQFDTEGTSTKRNPVFTFHNPGDKDISLMAYVPGCTTAIVTKKLTVLDGVQPSFEVNSNCKGQNVQFVYSASSEEVERFDWDFGDGNRATTENPTHSYQSEGIYIVTLTIETTLGCLIPVTDTVEVIFSPLASINYGATEENVPIEFTGIDLTSSEDSITTWEWVFNNQVFGEDKNAQITLSDSGTYEFRLRIFTEQGCQDSVLTTLKIKEAVCPFPSFEVDNAELCLGETLLINNQSQNGGVTFDWDFCIGELENGVEAKKLFTSQLFETPTGIDILNDQGISYAFIASRDNQKIFIVSDFGGENIVEELIVPGLTQPEWIEVTKEGDAWVGFILNTSGSLVRIVFSNGKSNEPEVQDLGKVEGLLSSGRGLELIDTDEGKFLFINDYGAKSLLRISFSASWMGPIENEKSLEVLKGIGSSFGLSILKACDSYFGLIGGAGSNSVYRISFGNSILNTPTIEKIHTVITPTDVFLLEEGGMFYGFAANTSGNVYRYSFGTDILSQPQIENLGNFDKALSNSYGFTLNKIRGVWNAYSLNYGSKTVSEIDFTAVCSSATNISTAFEPKNISYSAPGTYQIGLKVTDANGNTRSTRRTVTVSDQTSPPIAFRTLAIECATSEATFAVEAEQGDFESFEWEFSDGGTAVGDTVVHKFTAAGNFDVAVTGLSTNGCSNTERKTINIFSTPLDPAFELQTEQFCVNTPITLQNQTNESDYDPDVIRYLWKIGEWQSDEKSPVISIDSAGIYTLSMYVNIEGCESEPVEETFEVKETVVAGFSASAGCQEVPVVFDNLSESSAVSHTWDFGDGYTSTEYAPEHFYTEAGTYNVVLTVSNADGCVDTYSEPVTVAALPDPYFEYDLICEGQEVVLRDMSAVGSSTIVEWEWYLGESAEVISDKDTAAITFEAAGSEMVRLLVRAANGCEASYSQYVDVRDMPDVSFSSTIACMGETSSFVDQTPNADQIEGRNWLVNGKLIQGENDAQLDSAFAQPGTYEVELLVYYENFCSGSFSETVQVLKPPVPDFEVVGQCEGETISVSDLTNMGNDPVYSRTWLMGGESIGNGSAAYVPITESGSYEVTLQVLTAAGCTVSTSKAFIVHPGPEAEFIPSRDYGVPPFEISFENHSSNADFYRWFVDGVEMSDAENPIFTFSVEGQKDVKLFAYTTLGCSDSAMFSITSALPQVDIALNNLQVIESGSNQLIVLDISNNSNLPVEQIEAIVTLEDEFEVNETIIQRINVNEQSVVSLNLGIPLSTSKLSYLCVTLKSPYEVDDLTPENNENCVNLEPSTVVELPYPNPSRDQVSVRMVLPKKGDLKVTIIDLAGRVQHVQELPDRPEGLNTIKLDLVKLEVGPYFLNLNYQGKTYKTRIIKQ